MIKFKMTNNKFKYHVFYKNGIGLNCICDIENIHMVKNDPKVSLGFMNIICKL